LSNLGKEFLFILLNFKAPQTQGITNYGNRTEGHSRRSEDRIEQYPPKRIEDSGGNGNTQNIVKKSPEEILTNGQNGPFGQLDGRYNGSQIIPDQGNV
jgi:hypothetical protein